MRYSKRYGAIFYAKFLLKTKTYQNKINLFVNKPKNH
jgi:hypothetical protein